jgi:two-component system cell cycle response regulator DivK
MYVWCMRAAGWQVEAVADGEEAILVAAIFTPDVIVMDLHLPVIDGLEATRRLKADLHTRGIPVVALTGFDPRQAEPLARKAGCELFVAKPCPPERMLALLETLLTGRGEPPT